MENDEPHSVNQHYVPKLLLKKFSSKKSHIWVYDKEAKKNDWNFIKERPITKVASEDYFYDTVKGEKAGSYEYELRKIEKEIAPILEKIIQSKDLSLLTNFEKERISLFIIVQCFRTKYKLDEIKDLTTDLSEKLNSYLNVKNDFDYKSIWFSILKDASLFAKYISNKIWFLGESDGIFFSSDNPIVLQNVINNNPLRGTLGFDSYGIEIYFPLNDSLLLCMYCEKYLNEQIGLNSFIAENPIMNFEYENVLNINSLLFYQSDRFVFSSKNNFGMINRY